MCVGFVAPVFRPADVDVAFDRIRESVTIAPQLLTGEQNRVGSLSATDVGMPLVGYPRHEPTERSMPGAIVSPFLRWAGGKRQIVRELIKLLPSDIKTRTYREPFLGAASLFFAIRPSRAILSDANPHLIQCYELVRDDWQNVARYLREHAARNSKAYYYEVRAAYNRSPFSAAQAARFIYLNKTCFNGIFRVNRKGQFNVPYGWKEPPAIPNAEQLRRVAEALKGVSLSAASFASVFTNVSGNDFFYLDPPYPPLNGTAYFTHYTRNRFNQFDQEWLASWVRKLDKIGCRFMMTNADTDKIRRLYRGFRFARLPVTRFITCKSIRHKVKELVITNYQSKD
jgi:DNA adenine methylase